MTSKFDDTCRAAADKLIASIAAGDTDDWRVPWRSPAGLVSPINAATGNRYEGGNWILAMLTAFEHGWTCGRWGTYKQWQSLGRQVARGERGTQLVRWVPAKKKGDADSVDGDDGPGRRLVPFVFSVFAAEQLVPDPDASWQAPEPLAAGAGLDPRERHDQLDEWIASTGAEIRLGGNAAYYLGGDADRIHVPDHDAWDLWGDFYSTVAHELVHWSGHESRLGRPRVTGQDRSLEAQAFEELIAEFGAAMIGQHFGFRPSPRADHAAYLAHWADQLRADPRTLWRAAAAASKAVEHLVAATNAETSDTGDVAIAAP